MHAHDGSGGGVPSDAFAVRLATLLLRRRRDLGVSRRRLARCAGGQLRHRQLRALERGVASFDELDLDAVAAAYQVDLAVIFMARTELEVDLADGVLSAAGISERFVPGDDTTLCTAYLRLIRQLRRQPAAGTLPLRREDIEVLASVLRTDAGRVIEQLGALMGATVTQRRAAITTFSAGAAMILLASGAAAAPTGTPASPAASLATVQTAGASEVPGDHPTAAPAEVHAPHLPAATQTQTGPLAAPAAQPVDAQVAPPADLSDAAVTDPDEASPEGERLLQAPASQEGADDEIAAEMPPSEAPPAEAPLADAPPAEQTHGVELAPPQFHEWDDELGAVPGEPQPPDGVPVETEDAHPDRATADEAVELAPAQRHEWDDEHGAIEVDLTQGSDLAAGSVDQAAPDEPVELAQQEFDVVDKPV